MGQQETPESSLPLELAIQARFIAAYSNRRPEDIGEEERKDFQAFWNRTPDAFADLIRASVSDNAKMMMKYGMDTTITTLTFNGADLKEAYSQYDKDGQKKVMAALDERNHVFTREYIQAEIYPCMKHGFLDKLSDKQKKSICSAISLGREPSTERGKFNLFLVLYEMADDDRRMQMAQCIDLPANEIGSYIQVHPRPDNVVFEDARNETHEIHTDGPNDADASDLNGEKANGMHRALHRYSCR